MGISTPVSIGVTNSREKCSINLQGWNKFFDHAPLQHTLVQLEPHFFFSFLTQQGLLQSNLQALLDCSEQHSLVQPILHVFALELQHPTPPH